MADLRVTGASTPAIQPARPSEAARAAQRAFFQAALNTVAPTAAPRPVSPKAADARVAPTPQSRPPTMEAMAAEPHRYMRPGSLLDIKV